MTCNMITIGSKYSTGNMFDLMLTIAYMSIAFATGLRVKYNIILLWIHVATYISIPLSWNVEAYIIKEISVVYVIHYIYFTLRNVGFVRSSCE